MNANQTNQLLLPGAMISPGTCTRLLPRTVVRADLFICRRLPGLLIRIFRGALIVLSRNLLWKGFLRVLCLKSCPRPFDTFPPTILVLKTEAFPQREIRADDASTAHRVSFSLLPQPSLYHFCGS